MRSEYSLTVIFLFFFSFSLSYAKQMPANFDSQPEILFKYDQLKENQKKLKLQVDFNKAVMYLNKEEYLKAIEIFESTSSILKIPSFLNIGIAYYKLGLKYNAKLYLNKIYEHQESIYDNAFSYMSSCYYLFKITNDYKYLDTIKKVAGKHKKLSEHAKRLVVDTYVLTKEYKKAIMILDDMEFALDLKKALLYLKINNYASAEKYLEKALLKAVNRKKIDQILWFMAFRDLKENNLKKLFEHLDEIQQRRKNFKANRDHPIKMFFNPSKYTPKEYLKLVTKFDIDRKIDLVFYFAPFVFSDNDEIFYDSSKGFIFKSKQNLESLEEMVEYNANFLKVIKEDPIVRVNALKKFLKKDAKSYVYYNLALSYAQISDYHSAYKYFKKAYNMNPGNKIYSVMTLMSAKKINARIKDRSYMEQNLMSMGGLYSSFGQDIFKLTINPKLQFRSPKVPENYKNSIFYKAVKFLMNIDKKGIDLDSRLVQEHYKDPLVYLMKLTVREKGESDFEYYSRLQETIPLKHNDNFLSGSVIVTSYYVELLKASGLFNNADFNLEGSQSPSYLRTKALNELHSGDPVRALKILEKLQKEYTLEDKYTLYMVVAAYLEAGKYNDASLQVTLIKNLLRDEGADFLTGVQLMQDLKIISAKQYFKYPYRDALIDFRIVGLDKFIESL